MKCDDRRPADRFRGPGSGKLGRRGAPGPPPPPGGPETLFGVNPVAEALGAGLASELYLLARPEGEETGRLAALAERARAAGIKVAVVDRGFLDALARGGNHQGAAARVRPYAYAPFPAAAEPAGPRTVFALDGVTDVGNFAAMLRSFLAFGVDLVLIPADRSVSVNAAVHRLSSGASLRLPVARVTNLARALDELKGRGYFVYGADMAGEAELPAVDFAERRCVVLGGEERGIRPLVARGCDLVFRVPMSGAIESLNVAHAGAICAYALFAAAGGGQKKG